MVVAASEQQLSGPERARRDDHSGPEDLSGHPLARRFGIERLRGYRIAAGSRLDPVGLVKGTDFEPVALAKRQVGEIEAVLGPRPAAKQAIGRVVARFLDEAAQRVGADGSGVDRDRHQLRRVSGLSGAPQERLCPGRDHLACGRLERCGLDH